MATCSALPQGGACFDCFTFDMAMQSRLSLLCAWLTTVNPMATCNPDTLMANGERYRALTNDPAEIAELSLLQAVLTAEGGATLSVNTLLSRGKCFCGVTSDKAIVAKLQLLCEIQALA